MAGCLPVVLLIDASLLAGFGLWCCIAPRGLWELYIGSSAGIDLLIIDQLSRLLGSVVVVLAGFCAMASTDRLATDLQRRGVVALAGAVFGAMTLVHGIGGIHPEFHAPTVLTEGGVSLALMLLNSTGLMVEVYRASHPGPEPTVERHTLNINDDSDGEPSEHAPLLPDGEEKRVGGDGEEKRGGGDGEEQPKGAHGWTRLLGLASPEKRWLFAGCVALVIRLPFSLSIPHFVSECLGCLSNGDQHGALKNIAMLFAAGTVDAVLDFWNFFLFGYAQQRLIRRLRTTLFRTLLKQEISFYDNTPAGEVASRLQVDTAEMGNDLTWVFRWTIEAAVRILGVIVYMFVREWKLALLTVSAIPVCAVVNKLYGDWLQKNSEKVQRSLAAANDVAHEVLSSVRTVFSFNNQEVESQRYDKEITEWYHLNVKQTFMQSVYYMVIATFLINTCVQAGILLYGTHLVLHEGMGVSVLLAFMMYQGQLQQWVTNLLNSFTNLIKSTGAGKEVFDLLDRSPRIHVGSDVPPSDPRGAIAFSDVHFKYPSRSTRVLQGVTFEASPGATVALVGMSGAGKSTLFHLLEHFYEPVSGQVSIDGFSVTHLHPKWLHAHVALVGQEPVLFSGSIKSNILYSVLHEQENLLKMLNEDPELDAQYHRRVVEAAEIANARAFIEALPSGYDTEVGEKGVQLSGGQKQRIAIARAVIQNPSVLLLDEATSALDATSEAMVQQALERAAKGRTTLVIAHRLSTVVKADLIVLLDKGHVVEVGTHQELMAKPPTASGISYRTLVERQIQHMP